MTTEERLDRLERVAKLLITSARRTRNELRTNINALIDAQMRNEIRFNEQFASLGAAQAQTDLQIRGLIVAQRRTASQKELAVCQKH